MVCSIRTLLTLSALLGLNAAAQHASAADAPPQGEQAAPPVAGASAEDAAPTLEFLEFIGQWETDEGEWIAPGDLADESFVDLIDVDLENNTESAVQTGPHSDDVN